MDILTGFFAWVMCLALFLLFTGSYMLAACALFALAQAGCALRTRSLNMGKD